MSVSISDYPKKVTKLAAVAIGPDGEPAMLHADKPAGSVAEKFTWTAGKVTKIEYFSAYDPNTEDGTLIGTKNIRWNLDGTVKDTYWT